MPLTMLLMQWLYLLVDKECSLNSVFQPAKDPLFGFCHELKQIEWWCTILGKCDYQ